MIEWRVSAFQLDPQLSPGERLHRLDAGARLLIESCLAATEEQPATLTTHATHTLTCPPTTLPTSA